MNNESLRQHLAEKVMGGIYTFPSNNLYIKKETGDSYYKKWEPDENLEQAFMCLDTFGWWTIDKIPSGGFFSVSIENDNYT